MGYVASQNRLYLISRSHEIVSYQILTSVIDFQKAVVYGQIEEARSVRIKY